MAQEVSSAGVVGQNRHLDDVTKSARRAKVSRQRRIVWVLIGILVLLVTRDLYRFSHGEPLGFRLPMPSGLGPYAPAVVLMALFLPVVLAPMLGLGRSPHVVIQPGDVEFGLSDIYGATSLVDSLRQLIDEYRNFAVLESGFGGKPPRAVLFEGPPGTGKTMAAKVLAREAGVPFLFVSASSFQSMYYGQTNKKLRSYFRHLRRLTRRYGGAIGFIEEFDSIGASRAGLGGGTREGVAGVVGELLVQLQSFETPPRGLPWRKRRSAGGGEVQPRFLLLAATNRAHDLDPALIRPGRFDRTIRFDLPSKAARKEILSGLVSRRELSADFVDGSQAMDLLTSMTSGLSQAGMTRLVEEASILNWRRGGGGLSHQDLLDALSKMTLGGVDAVVFDEAQKFRIAVHEAGHGCYTWLTSRSTKVGLISIHKRSSALGLTAYYEPNDRYLELKSEMVESMGSLVAGMAAEEIFLHEPSTGSSNDLSEATKRAFGYVASFGFGGSLVSLGGVEPAQYTALVMGDGEVRESVSGILDQAKAHAKEILTQSASQVWLVVLRLMEKEEITEVDLRELLGPSRFEQSRDVELNLWESLNGSDR